MKMDDANINRAIHDLARMADKLRKLDLKDLAIQAEKIREDILFSLED